MDILRAEAETQAGEELLKTPDRVAACAHRDLAAWLAQRQVVLFGVVLGALVLGAFLPTLTNQFVNFDDREYIYANPAVQSGLSWRGLGWAFTTLERGFWHPLTWVSLMLDVQVFGPKPYGAHLTSLLLHAANAVLLFLVFRRMTGALWRSALVAALFGLHPLHVESVAWAAERKDVLSTFFCMLAVWAWAKYRVASPESHVQSPGSRVPSPESQVPGPESGVPSPGSQVPSPKSQAPSPESRSTFWYALALVFFAFGLMSKSMVMTFPFVLLLLDFWPLRRFETAENKSKPRLQILWLLIVEKVPFFVLSLVFAIVTVIAQNRLGAFQAGEQFSVGRRAANVITSYATYVSQMFWPANLSVFYPFARSISFPALAAGLLLVAVVTLVAVWNRRARPYLAVGWSWYLVTLVPVIGLVQAGGQAHADRYTYIPLVGLFTALVWTGAELARDSRVSPVLLRGCASALVFGLGALTWHQLGYWKNSETLFRHALRISPRNELARNNLGAALSNQGRWDEAITQLQTAVKLNPDHALAQANLGIALLNHGRLNEAIAHLEKAVELKPDLAQAEGNLGVALLTKGDVDQAIFCLEAAVGRQPDYQNAFRNLGIALGSKGRLDEAIASLQRAVRLDPRDSEARYNLAVAFAGKGRIDEAILQYQEVVRLVPLHAEAHNNLGAMLGRQGRLDEAVEQFREALRCHPGYKDAANNLKSALAARAGAPAKGNK